MKRSVNITGSRRTIAKKAATAKGLLGAMNVLGMSKKEQREFLEKAKAAHGKRHA